MLEFLFGRRNPTRLWPLQCNAVLKFDLDAASVNDVKLGEPLEALSFLGRDEESRSYRHGELLWYSKGLSVSFSPRTQHIVEYRIVQSHPLEPRFRPFAGTVLSQGREVELATLSAERMIEKYGRCFWQDRDEDEMIFFYEFVGLEWQIEFDLNSQLRSITTTSDPLMADEEQRLAYNVTARWPPP